MTDYIDLPVGLRYWQTDGLPVPQQRAGFEFTLLEDCSNAYRFTALLGLAQLGIPSSESILKAATQSGSDYDKIEAETLY